MADLAHLTRLRDWLHETPMSRCSVNSDVCDTWSLAIEIAELVDLPALRAEIERLNEHIVVIDADCEALEHHIVEFTESKHSRFLTAVRRLVDHAKKISPSDRMTIMVGDVEHALGMRDQPARTRTGDES